MRRVLPHAPRANFSGVPLFAGEVAVDEATGAIYTGDGATAGGNKLAFLSEVASAVGDATSGLTASISAVDAKVAAVDSKVAVIKPAVTTGDMTSVLQTALNTSNVSGLRVVEINEGTFTSASLTLKTGTVLRGRGKDKTTLKLLAASINGLIRCTTGESDITISDITLDGNNLGATSLSYLVAYNHIGSNIVFERVRFKNWSDRSAIQIYMDSPIKNIRFVDCEFLNLGNGGIFIGQNSGAQGTSDIQVINSIWDGCGGTMCAVHDYEGVGTATMDRRSSYYDVKFNFNVVRNCINFGIGNGPIPTELWGCTGVQQIGNLIESGTRGLSASAYNQDSIIAHNVIKNQLFYAMEGGPSRNTTVCHNTIVNCPVFYKDTTGATGKDATAASIPIRARVTNLSIYDNLVVGSGVSTYSSSIDTIASGSDGVSIPSNVRIYNNTFLDIENIRAVMRLSGQRPYPVFAGTAGTGAQFTYTYKAVKGQVENKGMGYTSAPTIALVSRDGNGTGMAATVTIDALGRLDQVTVTAAGSGYTAPPHAVLTGDGREGVVELIMGIDTIAIVAGGSGYTAGNFTVSGNGSCVNATGTYTVSSGVIDTVTVSTVGEGFGRASDFHVYNNTYKARTYASTIQFMACIAGNFLLQNNLWQRSALFDVSHPNGGSTLDVYQFTAATVPQGNPSMVSENDRVEMSGPNSTTRLSAVGSGTATSVYGVTVRGFKAKGNMSDNCFRFNDPSGTTVLEDIDVRDLNVSGTNINGNVNASLLMGLASGEYLIKAGAYVNIGAAKKKGRRVKLHYEGGTATRQVKVRHDRITGGQTQALIKVNYMCTITNATPLLGEVVLAYGNVSSAAVAPGSYQSGATATLASTGTPVETTVTLPTGTNNTWLCAVDIEIAGDGTVKSLADFSVQVG